MPEARDRNRFPAGIDNLQTKGDLERWIHSQFPQLAGPPVPAGSAGIYLNVKDFGARGDDGTTDDTAAILAALDAAGAAGGGTVFLPAGIYAISALLTVPQLVDLRGAGMHASILKATAAAAGIVYGGGVGANGTYHGHSCDFQLDGNNVSTAGFKANTISAHFSDILTHSMDGDGFYILGQNSSFHRIVSSLNDGSNFVFDNGAGHNTLREFWSDQATEKGIEFRRSAQSGASLYEIPTSNYCIEGIVERDGGSSPTHAAVGYTAGSFNYFVRCELHNFDNTDQSSVLLEPDPNGYSCGRLYIEDCTFGTANGNTEGAIHADAVSGGVAGAFNADYVVVLKGDNAFIEWTTAIKWGTSTPIRDLAQWTSYGTPTHFTPDGTGAARIWTPVTFQNSWANAGGGNTDVQYRLNQIGEVEIRGYAYRAAGASAASIFTLPVGYRPVGTSVTFTVPSGTGTTLVSIGSDGTVTCGLSSDAASLQITFDPT